ncbi:unnamed protein product [Brassica rapa subsp. trilocularis]
MLIKVDACTYEMDHLVLFILLLDIEKVDNSPSEMNNNVLLLEFCSHYNQFCRGCSCDRFGGHKPNSTLEEIKGCGAEIMYISEIDFREKNDEESNRTKKKMRVSFIIY